MGKNILTCLLTLGVIAALIVSCNKDDNKSQSQVTDIEGNIYKTVKIGSQVWMAENLKAPRYNDGTNIPLVTSTIDWGNLTTPGFCWYNNDEATYKGIYGALYNGYSVNTGKLCPIGWHVPTTKEWQQLRDILGDTIIGGGKLKESGTMHWLSPNTGADNTIGFTALPGGIRYLEGYFSAILYYTGIWTATEASQDNEWFLSLYYGDAIVKMSYVSKKYGFSVRCVKD